MRPFFSFLVALLFALAAMAAGSRKSVIISYPKETPDRILAEAKEAIVKAGGVITHEYNIIKGFAAQGPATVFDTVSSMSEDPFAALIETDGVVHTNHDEE